MQEACCPACQINDGCKNPKAQTMSEKSQIELGNDWGHYCRNNAAQSQSTSYSSPVVSNSSSMSYSDYQPSSPSYAYSSSQTSPTSAPDMSGIGALIAFVVLFLFTYPISALLGAAAGAMISFNMVFETIEQRNGIQILSSVVGCLILSKIEKQACDMSFVRWIQYLIRTIAILSILGYFVYALNLPKPQ